jgi:hypothetical protein
MKELADAMRSIPLVKVRLRPHQSHQRTIAKQSLLDLLLLAHDAQSVTRRLPQNATIPQIVIDI